MAHYITEFPINLKLHELVYTVDIPDGTILSVTANSNVIRLAMWQAAPPLAPSPTVQRKFIILKVGQNLPAGEGIKTNLGSIRLYEQTYYVFEAHIS